MKNLVLYGIVLACGLCVSAWMGIADAKAAASRAHDSVSAHQASTPYQSATSITRERKQPSQPVKALTRSRAASHQRTDAKKTESELREKEACVRRQQAKTRIPPHAAW